MAKLESETVKKPKGKKRKHNNVENEDEIANKSVIVERHDEEIVEPIQTNSALEVDLAQSIKKSKKRKNQEKSAIQEKRSKTEQGETAREHNRDEDHEAGEDDYHEPSLEELKESKKPENNLAVVTGRQKKKQKHQKLVEAQKDQAAEKEKQRNTEYLQKWKYARDTWKFEKLRQISIQQTMLESDKISDEVWSIALEYLAGSKGAAKEKIIKLANTAIEEVDKLCEQQETEQERQHVLNSVKYQRARDLLQIFD